MIVRYGFIVEMFVGRTILSSWCIYCNVVARVLFVVS